MTYEVETVRLDGPLGSEEDALVVRMPRARFLEFVERAAESAMFRVDGRDVRERLLATAQTIERFPVNAWIHPLRGCGCVVGEFLVAEGVVRREMCDMWLMSNAQVTLRLGDAGYGRVAHEVVSFGISLDNLIRDEIDSDRERAKVTAVLIEDDERKGGTA